MDKRVFDDAIGEVPPSTVDVDAVIAGGRRAARVRRLANPAVAAGVAVVALTGVVAYTMTGDEGTGAPVGSPVVASSDPTTPTTTSDPAPSDTPTSGPDAPPPPTGGTNLADSAVPPPQCDEDMESPGVVKGRLTAKVTEAVQGQRADLQLSPNAEGQYPQGTPHGPLEFYQVNNQAAGEPLPVCDANGYFMAVATTQAPEGGGNLLFTVSPAYAIDGMSMECADARLTEQVFCETVNGENGEVIMKTTYQFPGGVVMHRVELVRQDGNKLMVQAENTNTSSKSSGVMTAPAPPLTLDQLVAIGIDTDLTVFPE